MAWQPSFNGSHVQADIPRGLPINDYDEFSVIYHECMGRDIARLLMQKIGPEITARIREKGAHCVGNEPLHIIDLACGSGEFLTQVVAEHGTAVRAIGIDRSEGQIASAREHTPYFATGSIEYRVGDVLTAPLPEGVDIITMNLDALNHLREPAQWSQLFARVNAALRLGGEFLFDINTKDRLEKDWDHPEIIVKPDMTYVQIGSEPGHIDVLLEDNTFVRWARRQLYMEAFQREEGQHNHYRVLVEQIAPPPSVLYTMLEDAGFHRIAERYVPKTYRQRHIFLKNRLFVSAFKYGPERHRLSNFPGS